MDGGGGGGRNFIAHLGSVLKLLIIGAFVTDVHVVWTTFWQLAARRRKGNYVGAVHEKSSSLRSGAFANIVQATRKEEFLILLFI